MFVFTGWSLDSNIEDDDNEEADDNESTNTGQNDKNETTSTSTKTAKKGSGLLSFFRIFINKTLTREDLTYSFS
jgi:hypothetical protein